MSSEYRALVREEIARVSPLDQREREDISRALTWIDSGAELCRLRKPDVPPVHLVSYFVLAAGMDLLLVDHINAQLWLPTGGHVEPGEDPRDAARREAQEELGVAADFLIDGPVFVTVTETVGLTAGHTDVSLWYLLAGDRSGALAFDQEEFNDARWFHPTEIPYERSDPEMRRFVSKLAASSVQQALGSDATTRHRTS